MQVWVSHQLVWLMKKSNLFAMMFYFILPVRCALCSFFRFGSARFYLDGSIYVFFLAYFETRSVAPTSIPKNGFCQAHCEINSFIIFCFQKHLSPPKNRIFSQCKICKSQFQLVLLKNRFVIPFYNSFKYVLYYVYVQLWQTISKICWKKISLQRPAMRGRWWRRFWRGQTTDGDEGQNHSGSSFNK